MRDFWLAGIPGSSPQGGPPLPPALQPVGMMNGFKCILIPSESSLPLHVLQTPASRRMTQGQCASTTVGAPLPSSGSISGGWRVLFPVDDDAEAHGGHITRQRSSS